MELTREIVEAMCKCLEQPCDDCILNSKICAEKNRGDVAKALLSEMDKPKHDVWSKAPEWATIADVEYRHYGDSREEAVTFTRTLPKSCIDEVAEEVGTEKAEKYGWNPVAKQCAIDIAKAAIMKDRELRSEG